MSAALNVAVVGQVTHDRYEDELLPGGCAFYGAHVYRALGAHVQLATSVGDDFRCDGALAGLRVARQRAGTTTVFANAYPPGRPREQRVEAQAPQVPVESARFEGRIDLLHLAPVMGDVDLEAWKSSLRARVLAISVQGWIKQAGGIIAGTRPPAREVIPRVWDVSAAALAGIDAVCVSHEDLIGQDDLLGRLCAAIPIVALTHGHAGSEVFVRGYARRVGIYPTAARDPTGAGDTFAAGFFHELALGQDPIAAARLGAALASIAIEARGANRIDPRLALQRAGRVAVE